MYSPQAARSTAVPASAADTAAALVPSAHCARQLHIARERTRALFDRLPAEAMLGPRLSIVNPPLWELGHLGWFQERWLLRPRADGSLAPCSLPGGDLLYDSARVAHATRWDLPLPSLDASWRWLEQIFQRVLERLERLERPADDCSHDDCAPATTSGGRGRRAEQAGPLTTAPAAGSPGSFVYYAALVARHEQMHAEAFSYSRQTLAYPALAGSYGGEHSLADTAQGDVEMPGGAFELGSRPDEGFAFDNEKWAHPVSVSPFAIARRATSTGEFAAFVDAGGYDDRRWWCAEGWQWRLAAGAHAPAYWRPMLEQQGWEQRCGDRWEPLSAGRMMLHVNAWEAAAWCRWARRRLPTEAEWEFAAAAVPGGERRGAMTRRPYRPYRPYPWGDAPPVPGQANLWWPDGRSAAGIGSAEVDAYAGGDSAHGCRQMLGNAWEWTASVFAPYPGFVVDPYQEYSQPWFGTHRVLRGGSFATDASLVHNRWRNFYMPDRRDVYAGFRSCAVNV